jgi:hypothetical protein
MKDLKDTAGAVATALAVVGSITFGVLHIAYERFYDAFGVSPEEVGVDPARVLSQSASGLVLALAVFLVPAAGYLIVRGARTRSLDMGTVWTVVLAAVLFSFGLFVKNAADADDAGACAARADGQSVRSIRFQVPLGPAISMLGVQAQRAVIHATDRSKPPAWDGSRVVYLGTNDGTTIVFDPRARAALRIPLGSVTVATDASGGRYRKKDGCRVRGGGGS